MLKLNRLTGYDEADKLILGGKAGILRHAVTFLELLLLFCMGMGMVLSALAVYFRDMLHLYSVMLMAWMYLTPIFYPISALPEGVAFFVRLNPMYHYVTFFREVVLYGVLPAPSLWLGCFGYGLASLSVGLLVFRRLQRNFILYL